MKTIAFVTYDKQPDATPDDALAAEALRERNCRVDCIPWNRAGIDWASYDMIVLRSCWDYHVYPQEFSSWLDHLQKTGCRVSNPVSVVRDNMHKKYLFDLQRKGVAIPVTFLFAQGNTVNLPGIFEKHGWEKAVIKPAVSAGGVDTWLGTSATMHEDNKELNRLLSGKDMIVQEYSEAIVTAGELSLLFFNGEFSHAVCKTPQPDEFRINTKYKGMIASTDVSVQHIATAARALELYGVDNLYARVDGIVEHNVFRLMELELIEPAIFFQHAPGSAEEFANALLHRVESMEA
jgi:glutathione synthase/RimK-type ligase-like ATP-grasp enzyme